MSHENFMLDGIRMLLVYAHLLLCVFALQRVLVTDWRVLRGRIGRSELERTHGLMILLLAGLWTTGLAIISIDLSGQIALIVERPKALVKLGIVVLLTANGAVIGRWCLPRMAAGRQLGVSERFLLVVTGALSTAGWALAAFIGTARPAAAWALPQWLLLAAVVLMLALLAGLALAGTGRWPLLAAPAGMRSPRAATVEVDRGNDNTGLAARVV